MIFHPPLHPIDQGIIGTLLNAPEYAKCDARENLRRNPVKDRAEG